MKLPKFLSGTFLNANIHRLRPNFEIGSKRGETQ
jgi:hypothetical protein